MRDISSKLAQGAPDAYALDSLVVGDQQLVHPTILGDAQGPFVFLGGHQHRLPGGIGIAFGRSRGIDHCYVLDTRRGSSQDHSRLHVLVGTRGGVRELTGVPADVLVRLRRTLFPTNS
ncbi:hypothetical protein [Microbacterium trichothecenolyticum]|uniref:Uncharacterized protein n=1 Tax=Microbacterium trichothecenolyticum TaxID=69370 RepID=A0ABU0TZ06_MICTR|nr:hypothetical protein [Microbacterium trichothecenolyticum]MDQ1124891.1 hypothetical protein [Microbacterium trichothecenolyticum]